MTTTTTRNATEDDVLSMIEDGAVAAAVVKTTGWAHSDLIALARLNGYGVNAANGRFQPAAAGRATGDIRPMTPTPRPIDRDLVAEGLRSTIPKVVRAATKASKALAHLAHVLDETRQAEAARRAVIAERARLQAEVDALAQQLAEKRAALRGPKATASPSLGGGCRRVA